MGESPPPPGRSVSRPTACVHALPAPLVQLAHIPRFAAFIYGASRCIPVATITPGHPCSVEMQGQEEEMRTPPNHPKRPPFRGIPEQMQKCTHIRRPKQSLLPSRKPCLAAVPLFSFLSSLFSQRNG